MSANKAVFIDRDGTLARDMPYCSRPEDFQLLPTVGNGLRLLNENGFKTIVITNQSGIAHGYFDEERLAQIHAKMQHDMASYGAHVDAIYYCPHHPQEECLCRKPNTGMLEQAIRDWGINTDQSYFIGDKYLDIQAANSMGCKAVIVPSSEPELALLQGPDAPSGRIDFISRDFISASRWVLATAIPMDDVSIIIPTKNEEQNLQYVLPYIPHSAEVIVVDGHSSDNTVRVARELRPEAIVLHQKRSGKGDALKLGFSHASREFIVTFDADGSFLPGEIYRFIQPLRLGYDLIKGSRFMPGGGTLDMPLTRRLGNQGLTTVANMLYDSHYTDLVYGFHAFRRDALKRIELHSDGFELDTELYLRACKAGLKIAELPSFENSRIYGVGKLRSLRDGSKILKTILRERFNG